MRLRVGFGHSLVFDGQQLSQGDEFDVEDESAAQWLRSGMVLPADGIWPGGIHTAPESPSESPDGVAHEPCDPGPKPAKHRGAMQTCPVAGCPCLTWQGKCTAHARTSSTSGKAYGTGHRNVRADLRRRWESVRREYLHAYPYCECADCAAIAEPLRPAANEVDHIDGLGLLGPRAFDWSNLQSLTSSHHSRKTARESFGH